MARSRTRSLPSPTAPLAFSVVPRQAPAAPEAEASQEAELDPVPPGPKLRGAWTLGNSQTLVEGTSRESPLVSFAWIAIPTGLALLILWFMTR